MNTPPYRETIDKDQYFMLMAYTASLRSKDPSTNIGAVIVGPRGKDDNVRSTGYNGLPRGANDCLHERYQRPLKYQWFEHAERNAIFSCARMGVATDMCRMYTNGIPCADCGRAVVQCGISELVVHHQWPMNGVTSACAPEGDAPAWQRWADSLNATKQMFAECGVKVTVLHFDIPDNRIHLDIRLSEQPVKLYS